MREDLPHRAYRIVETGSSTDFGSVVHGWLELAERLDPGKPKALGEGDHLAVMPDGTTFREVTFKTTHAAVGRALPEWAAQVARRYGWRVKNTIHLSDGSLVPMADIRWSSIDDRPMPLRYGRDLIVLCPEPPVASLEELRPNHRCPPLGSAAEVKDRLDGAFVSAGWRSLAAGLWESNGGSALELSYSSEGLVDSLHPRLHVAENGDQCVDALLGYLKRRFGWQAFAVDSNQALT